MVGIEYWRKWALNLQILKVINMLLGLKKLGDFVEK